MSVILQTRDLCRRAKGRDLVAGIDLDLRKGEVLGLVGPNGSGKSSLLGLLAGLTLPSRGAVLLDGVSLSRLSRRAIARRIALVAQSADTDDRVSVRDAVELGRTPWLGPFDGWGPSHAAAVDAALAAVGMTDFADRDWTSLSGGERQRAHIARAHAQTPDILLLDEPTNHLDIHHQIAIMDLVAALGATTVVALHDLHHALRCDRVLVMQAGRAVALGPPAEVLTPALIRAVFAVDAVLIPAPGGGPPVFAFQRLA